MSYLMLEHQSELCRILLNGIADALGAKQMWIGRICLEPTPDLEEEASGWCV